MAPTLCDECSLFKETFESFTGDYSIDTFRTPFPNLTSLENSALSGCSLCQMIYQSWHCNQYHMKFKEQLPIEVKGSVEIEDDSETSFDRDSQNDTGDSYKSKDQRIFIYQKGLSMRFLLRDFHEDWVDEQGFSEYQNAFRQIADLGAPDSIDKVCSLASKWIRNCDQTHQHCGSSHTSNREPKVLPTRLIDVGTDSLGQPPRLFIPRRHSRSFEYAALSYAWGPVRDTTKTTSSNLEAMTQRLPWAQLPKTIQDAILITRRLGIRYLWVDALCILQSEGPNDVKHKEDWSYEAARFGDYYGNALLTIAATGASSSENGLLLPRPASRFEPRSITFRPGMAFSHTIRPILPSWYTETFSAPLLDRGWAVQERFLSRRVLHFAKNMILWECHDCRASELDPQGLKPFGQQGADGIISEFMTIFRDLGTDSLVSKDFIREWYMFVEEYSQKGFSFVSDRLPALSGIVSIIQDRTQQKYVAGLWESAIPEGLAWMTDNRFCYNTTELLDSGDANEPKKAGKQLKLPSWCWAASRGYASFLFQSRRRSHLKVEAWNVESQGTDTSGQVSGGRVTLRSLFGTLNLSDLGFVFHPDADIGDHIMGRDPQEGWLEYSQIGNTEGSTLTRVPASQKRAATELSTERVKLPPQTGALAALKLSLQISMSNNSLTAMNANGRSRWRSPGLLWPTGSRHRHVVIFPKPLPILVDALEVPRCSPGSTAIASKIAPSKPWNQ
ncbi:related to tol protein [Fusarium torulosum]|uniref:Related to tol protein n=1 Tax=Fusarium torulosum TaxID=33205 RepID=A0AAE8SMP2_9HYPO|nr:related to tol protein [Fusarium torulosum]